ETERQHTAEAQVLENLLPAGAGPERVRAGLDLVVHAEDARVEPEEERSADQVLGGERVGDLRERGADRDAEAERLRVLLRLTAASHSADRQEARCEDGPESPCERLRHGPSRPGTPGGAAWPLPCPPGPCTHAHAWAGRGS